MTYESVPVNNVAKNDENVEFISKNICRKQ